MFVEPVFEQQNVLRVAGVVLGHSDHLRLLEQRVQGPLQDYHVPTVLWSEGEELLSPSQLTNSVLYWLFVSDRERVSKGWMLPPGAACFGTDKLPEERPGAEGCTG